MSTIGTAGRPLHVAIVGSGPSGFYAAEALLQAPIVAEVDVLERLPVPYGLVRFGVAPDHAKLKAVTKVFEQVAQHERFHFFGNVALGRDVSVEDLAARYHAVIVATGAADDRKLGIPGEQLAGVHAASDFVGWYNGHPDCSALRFDLSHEVAVVVGQGNVAIDVCRILAKPVDELRCTDIAEHALDVLATSRVREIHLIGRRGPAQAKFTHKELRELCTLAGWQTLLEPDALALNEASLTELAHPDHANGARNLEVLKGLSCVSSGAGRSIRLHFQCAPLALHGSGRLERVVLEAQRLAGPAFQQRAEPTGRLMDLDAGLLFRSVGYRGTPLQGLPFDAHSGTLPHRDGRLLSGSGEAIQGWYVTGWIKRGPTGIIGTNRLDSVETVSRLLEDLPSLDGAKEGRASLYALLRGRDQPVVSFEGWRAIESVERQRGSERSKTAEKFICIADMVAAAERAPASAH